MYRTANENKSHDAPLHLTIWMNLLSFSTASASVDLRLPISLAPGGGARGREANCHSNFMWVLISSMELCSHDTQKY